MPLRDHFKPPIFPRKQWQWFHAYWPGVIMNQMYEVLPPGFSAEPRVQLGRDYEVDIGTVDERPLYDREGSGGLATMTVPAATTQQTVAFHDPDVYEVQVYNEESGGTLVAVIELVSPGNQDRPINREKFIEKCEALIGRGVCVSMIDIVTAKRFNLHADVLQRFGVEEKAFADVVPNVYVSTIRRDDVGRSARLQTWAYPLAVGQPLHSLPVWLNWETMVTLDVEATYEKACKDMRIA